MSQPSTQSIPPWLSQSISISHLNVVVQSLGGRELLRERARALSRNQHQILNRLLSPIYNPKSHQSYNGHYSVEIACRPENHKYNRYLHVEPYDRNRVVAREVGQEMSDVDQPDEGKGRYLNASWVLERYGLKWWIATQAPLPKTSHAFLSLIMQPCVHPPSAPNDSSSGSQPKGGRIRTVVQLTQDIEGGRRKADPYFPSEVGRSTIVYSEQGHLAPALKVTLLDKKLIQEVHCVQSTISVVPITPPLPGNRTNDDDNENDAEEQDDYGQEDEERIIFQHLLYTAWPDHGVPDPEDRASLLAFIKLVDHTNRDLFLSTHPSINELDPDPPIIIGCSAGIGRTGSFIALSSLLRHSNFLSPSSNSVDISSIPISPLGSLPILLDDDLVVQEIDSLREQRPGMVQREEQVFLIYEVLAAAFSG